MELRYRLDFVRRPGFGLHKSVLDDYRKRKLQSERQQPVRGACICLRQSVSVIKTRVNK